MTKYKLLFRSAVTFFVAGALLLSLGSLAYAAKVTTAPVNDLSTFAPIGDGAVSTIIREIDGVTVTVHTTLDPGPHTVWLLVWNDSSRCTADGGGCLPPPFGSDPPDSVFYATGNVVPSTGVGNFTARLGVGETANVTGGIEQAGLTNPMGAEIHAILRSKGSVIPDLLDEQLSNFQGGCDVNACANVQGAAHSPTAPDELSANVEKILTLTRRIAASHSVLRRGE